ncbi:hypothetical protein [Photobacterium sp. GJ3]|uniref:hypothetical protein n=1 Tax=Photobacterium sp. GJ3 TaxID=2829502 RepID=UPI002010CC23|nr:hypothetical protein [Photobacterium sp. GJ3]
MKPFFLLCLLICFSSGKATANNNAPTSDPKEIEFLHWWTSKGEVAAFNLVKDALLQAGVSLLDQPIPGGGGDTAMSILQARAIAGTPRILFNWKALRFNPGQRLAFCMNLNRSPKMKTGMTTFCPWHSR